MAGLTAALTAARDGCSVQVLTGAALGGHLLSVETVDGFPGFPDGAPGYDLCPIVQEQAVAAGAGFAAREAERIEPAEHGWTVSTREGPLAARTVILATGTSLKKLGVPGEERLFGKGVSHCATCDGPLLRGRTVGIVGGGDSAAQEGLTLAGFADKVIIFHRGQALTAQKVYAERVAAQGNMEVRYGNVVEEVLGDATLSAVRVSAGGETAEVPLDGLFVYIGLAPNTGWLDGLVARDAGGLIVTDAEMRCAPPGLLAAGTIRAGAAGRAAGAAGDGAMAAVAAMRYLADGAWSESAAPRREMA